MWHKNFTQYQIPFMLSIIVIGVFFITFVGCGGDEDIEDVKEDVENIVDNGNADLQSAGAFAAKVDGEDWKSEIAVATFEGNILSVTGQAFPGGIESGKSEQIGFIIQNVSSAGKYPLDLLSGNSGRVALAEAGDDITINVYLAESGEVDITAIDDNGAKGTFHFKAISATGGGTVEITSGTFDVKFQ